MGQMRGARFDRYCIIEVVLVHLTADIHTRARARHFFAWASAPHLGRDGDGTGLACVFALCLILYLGWEHGFGGMALLINILYTLYCTSTSTRCESTRWVEELLECFLPSCSLFFSVSSVSAKISDICIYTLAEKLEPGYGLLYIMRQVNRSSEFFSLSQ